MQRSTKPELIDEEAPEATDDWFARARPAKAVLPELLGVEAADMLLQPRRGRPPAANPKSRVNIRLDSDIVQAFRSSGSGWQTRLNQALREWLASRGEQSARR